MILSIFLAIVQAGAWYKLNAMQAFNAPFDYNDYNSGGCSGHYAGIKDAKYMEPPYIESTADSVTAQIPLSDENSHACIYQHTQNSCRFFIGENGVTQMEFDYVISGNQWTNWFSFWINSAKDGREWVKDCEIDPLEYSQWLHLRHNWAGLPNEVEFKSENAVRGHVTTIMSDTRAAMTDCVFGSYTCDMSGYGHEVATHEFAASTTADIRAKRIIHHLAIDYWKAARAGGLHISNIRLKGQGDFTKMCEPISEIRNAREVQEFYQLTPPTEQEQRDAEAQRAAREYEEFKRARTAIKRVAPSKRGRSAEDLAHFFPEL